jgi:MraZ protein
VVGRESNKNRTMFIGQYAHTIDDKKRISLPVKFRKEIGKKIVLTHGLDRCLFAYGVKEWAKISEKLGNLGMLDANSRGFNRFMLAGAQEIDVDSNGRILIPEHLKEFAGVKDTVVFAGVFNRIEIWNEASWKSYQSKVSKEADQMAEKLGEIGAI